LSKHLVERMRLRIDGMTVSEAEAEINHVFSALRGAMIDGETVRVRGFGTFRRKLVGQRKARNPMSGEPVIVREHHKIVFKEPKPRR
jgi:nucleoid DNA-binding protein